MPSAFKISANEDATKIDSGAPHPGQWTLEKGAELFIANPIVVDNELAFIKTNISNMIAIVQLALLHKIMTNPLPSCHGGGGSWIGKYPHFLLIHSTIDDNDIKSAYYFWLNSLIFQWKSRIGTPL